MRVLAEDTYLALKGKDGITDEQARNAAAETGRMYIFLRNGTDRLGILTGVVLAGFSITIALIAFLFRVITGGSP